MLTVRYVATDAERPRWRVNAAYGLTDRILVGVEYNPAVKEVLPTLNWVISPEGHGAAPLVSFGTSSDRIFSPEGTRSYFVSVAKTIPGTNLAPYVSPTYSEWEDRITLPFGVNARLAPSWDFLAMNDGTNSHFLLTWKSEQLSTSLLLVKARFWGLSLGTRF